MDFLEVPGRFNDLNGVPIFHIMREEFERMAGRLVVNPWWLVDPISAIVQHALEHGLLKQQERLNSNVYQLVMQSQRADWETVTADMAPPVVGAINSYAMAFVVLLVGAVPSTLAFAAEIIYFRRGSGRS